MLLLLRANCEEDKWSATQDNWSTSVFIGMSATSDLGYPIAQ